MRHDPSDNREHPYRGAVFAAAVGSSILAVFGTGAALLLAVVSLSFASEGSGSDLPVTIAFTALGAAILALGYYAMVGYWRIVLRRLPVAQRFRVWAVSALYNGAGLMLFLGSVWSATLHTVEQTVMAVLILGWLGFMTVLSVQCARLAPRSDLGD
ncbi:MAG: hypothetical protein Rubg2KO_28320 [Rubricoccaceae bacterium]